MGDSGLSTAERWEQFRFAVSKPAANRLPTDLRVIKAVCSAIFPAAFCANHPDMLIRLGHLIGCKTVEAGTDIIVGQGPQTQAYAIFDGTVKIFGSVEGAALSRSTSAPSPAASGGGGTGSASNFSLARGDVFGLCMCPPRGGRAAAKTTVRLIEFDRQRCIEGLAILFSNLSHEEGDDSDLAANAEIVASHGLLAPPVAQLQIERGLCNAGKAVYVANRLGETVIFRAWSLLALEELSLFAHLALHPPNSEVHEHRSATALGKGTRLYFVLEGSLKLEALEGESVVRGNFFGDGASSVGAPSSLQRSVSMATPGRGQTLLGRTEDNAALLLSITQSDFQRYSDEATLSQMHDLARFNEQKGLRAKKRRDRLAVLRTDSAPVFKAGPPDMRLVEMWTPVDKSHMTAAGTSLQAENAAFRPRASTHAAGAYKSVTVQVPNVGFPSRPSSPSTTRMPPLSSRALASTPRGTSTKGWATDRPSDAHRRRNNTNPDLGAHGGAPLVPIHSRTRSPRVPVGESRLQQFSRQLQDVQEFLSSTFVLLEGVPCDKLRNLRAELGVLEALVDEKLVGEESPGQQQRRRRRRAAKDAPDATSHQIAERLEGQARAIKQQIALVRLAYSRSKGTKALPPTFVFDQLSTLLVNFEERLRAQLMSSEFTYN